MNAHALGATATAPPARLLLALVAGAIAVLLGYGLAVVMDDRPAETTIVPVNASDGTDREVRGLMHLR